MLLLFVYMFASVVYVELYMLTFVFAFPPVPVQKLPEDPFLYTDIATIGE